MDHSSSPHQHPFRPLRQAEWRAIPPRPNFPPWSSPRAAPPSCSHPPLKVVLDRAHTADTIFAHQGGSLKLVVQCRSSRSYANYLLEEHLIYRVYNLLTERSVRARLAVVTYVDPREKHETRHGFF